jgi:hypothetical protein
LASSIGMGEPFGQEQGFAAGSGVKILLF